jgi:hypothetical protein
MSTSGRCERRASRPPICGPSESSETQQIASLEQSTTLPSSVKSIFFRGGHFGQARHGQNVAADHDDEFAPAASRTSRMLIMWPGGRARNARSVEKRILRLGDANRVMPVAVLPEVFLICARTLASAVTSAAP